MARTKDPKVEEERRALVAGATRDLLAEGSWRKMTLADVAKRAGVSKGVVTYWFDSKEELVVEAIDRFHRDYEASLGAVMIEQIPAREKMIRLLELAMPSHDEIAREVRFQIEVWSFAKEHPAVLERITDTYSRFRMACEALLLVGVQEGYVTRADTAGLYRFFHALIDGLSLHIAHDPSIDIVELRRQLLVQLERWFQD